MFGKVTFKGGIHPPHFKKQTSALSIYPLPAPDKVIIPLSMHIGAPAKLVVKKGDAVKMGQVLAEAGGFVSAPVHASVSGTITAICPMNHPLGRAVTAVEITNDKLDDKVSYLSLDNNWKEVASGEIIQKISAAGIVGMGGASFPTHVKLSPPPEKKIDTLIINGAECEPYLTADHRILLENTDEVLIGVLILKKAIGAKSVYIGIEENKQDAIKLISEKLSSSVFSDISLKILCVKYPQGGEKQLINAITKREVPSGGLPMDVGCVVQNVGTAYAIWDAVINGTPLIERVVTVTGPLVKKPANLLVRIGTPIETVLNHCETDIKKAKKILMGGPMMGLTQSELSAPVIKSTSGLLAIDFEQESVKAHNCISCGNCVKACPINLVPSYLGKYVTNCDYESAEKWNILDCMECGSCSFVCPSKINLVHLMKLGKFHIMASRKAAMGK